jgi:hypothetical protein
MFYAYFIAVGYTDLTAFVAFSVVLSFAIALISSVFFYFYLKATGKKSEYVALIAMISLIVIFFGMKLGSSFGEASQKNFEKSVENQTQSFLDDPSRTNEGITKKTSSEPLGGNFGNIRSCGDAVTYFQGLNLSQFIPERMMMCDSVFPSTDGNFLAEIYHTKTDSVQKYIEIYEKGSANYYVIDASKIDNIPTYTYSISNFSGRYLNLQMLAYYFEEGNFPTTKKYSLIYDAIDHTLQAYEDLSS